MNEMIFNHLKQKVKKFPNLDNALWILGVKIGRASFEDHAILFMVKGIRRKRKMLVCFGFCEGTSPTPDLVRIIKILIRGVRKTGLKVVATISDQGATNQAAINNLLQATSQNMG
nr:unnamed protein product [Callosobruchus analis]